MAEACGRQARSDALPYRRRGRQNREWRTECPGYGSCCCLPPARAPHSRRRWEGSPRRFHGSIGKAGGEQHHDGIETHEQRSEEHTSELKSLMRISNADFCLKKKKIKLKSENETKLERIIQNTNYKKSNLMTPLDKLKNKLMTINKIYNNKEGNKSNNIYIVTK